jgi:hypothetical protein
MSGAKSAVVRGTKTVSRPYPREKLCSGCLNTRFPRIFMVEQPQTDTGPPQHKNPKSLALVCFLPAFILHVRARVSSHFPAERVRPAPFPPRPASPPAAHIVSPTRFSVFTKCESSFMLSHVWRCERADCSCNLALPHTLLHSSLCLCLIFLRVLLF